MTYSPTPEHRAAMSRALRGRQFSPEHRAKISAGKVRESVGYSGAHFRARVVLAGQPCEGCGATVNVEAAWRHDAAQAHVDADKGRYSMDPADYRPLCTRCHRAYDASEHAV